MAAGAPARGGQAGWRPGLCNTASGPKDTAPGLGRGQRQQSAPDAAYGAGWSAASPGATPGHSLGPRFTPDSRNIVSLRPILGGKISKEKRSGKSGPRGCAQGKRREPDSAWGRETTGQRTSRHPALYALGRGLQTHPGSRRPGSKGHLALTNEQTRLLKTELGTPHPQSGLTAADMGHTPGGAACPRPGASRNQHGPVRAALARGSDDRVPVQGPCSTLAAMTP